MKTTIKFLPVLIVIALVSAVALTVLTMVASSNARDRADCLKAAQAVEQCPTRSWWEALLIRAVG